MLCNMARNSLLDGVIFVYWFQKAAVVSVRNWSECAGYSISVITADMLSVPCDVLQVELSIDTKNEINLT